MPCELMDWYILPTIRYKLEVSERLGITQAAVSQYVKGKRGKTMEFKEDVKEAIKRLTNDIAENSAFGNLIPRIWLGICMQIKISIELCELHKGRETVQEDYDVCLRTQK